MAQTTKKGDDLAAKLNPLIGTTREIRETCALIARHATTYHGIQEQWCSVDFSDRPGAAQWLEDREAAIVRRLVALAESLPHTDYGAWRVEFDGDPRGSCSWLVAPDPDAERLYDDWGRRGFCTIV